MSRSHGMNRGLYLTALFAAVILFACAPAPRTPVSQLDTPDHHVFTGMNLLDNEKYADAQREFELALSIDNKFSKAYTGVALVKTYTGDYKTAAGNLEKAEKYAKTNDEKIFYYIGNIRYYSKSKAEKKWLKICKENFDDAIKLDSRSSAAYYFMGIAYKQAYEFNSAGQMFTKVLELKGRLCRESRYRVEFHPEGSAGHAGNGNRQTDCAG